jgi:hypothetical protein
MEFSQHALEKCTLYGVNPELVREALTVGETFLDLTPDDAREGRIRIITAWKANSREVQDHARWCLAQGTP